MGCSFSTCPAPGPVLMVSRAQTPGEKGLDSHTSESPLSDQQGPVKSSGAQHGWWGGRG